VAALYRAGRALPLPQQCVSLHDLYSTVVLDVRYIRDVSSSGMLGGRANVVLYSAALATRNDFQLAPSVEWVGFAPNTNPITIADRFLRDCAALTTIDLTPLTNITSVGGNFLKGCTGLTTVDLTPLTKITSIGDRFLARKGWLLGATTCKRPEPNRYHHLPWRP